MAVTVAKDGAGEFTSVQEAIEALSLRPEEERTIRIKSGIYRELVRVHVPGFVLIGEDPLHTQIRYGLSALDLDENGEKLGTFRTATFMVEADHIRLENLTIANDAGPGWKAAQGIALYADGDDIRVKNCRLLGHQDTLFMGPRLRKIEMGLYHGEVYRQSYEDCYIAGDVDFVFGCGASTFKNCEFFSIYSKCPEGETDHTQKPHELIDGIYGYVTAASTPEGQEQGFVMENCRFTGDCPEGSVYLGRPWRSFARVELIHCELGKHIHKEGWHNWWKKDAEKTAYYREKDCFGPGADSRMRPDWIHIEKRNEVL